MGIKAAHRSELVGEAGFARHITGIKLPPTERQRNYSKNQQRPTQDLPTGRLLATTRS